MRPVVSVVVPTYRRPEMLQRCMAAILSQRLDRGSYEVIVVDDEPSEATRAAVEQVRQRCVDVPAPSLVSAVGGRRASAVSGTEVTAAPPDVRYIAMHARHGPAAARNAGWRAARANIVAFTDDDCIPLAGWLLAGVQALPPGVAGVDGRVIVPLPRVPTDAQLSLTGLERSRFVTANCFYRKEALVAAGGFDERFPAPWREDSDLFFTLLERGRTLEHTDDALVVHPVRPPQWGISLREQKKSIYNALLFKKHPQLYRERIQARPPVRYYAAIASFIGAMIALACGRRRAAAIGVSAWAAITMEFAAERSLRTSHERGHLIEMLVTSALIPPMSVWWRLRGAWKYRVFFL